MIWFTEVLFLASKAFAWIVYEDGVDGTNHAHAYGAIRTVHLSFPFTQNSTLLTPTLSFAAASILIVEFVVITAPLIGLVILTVGG